MRSNEEQSLLGARKRPTDGRCSSNRGNSQRIGRPPHGPSTAPCAELGIKAKRTRPYRPQTNGKIERFHRTLADGWAYARFYDSTQQRSNALDEWLHFYNHHRAHSAIGGQPPITRVTNVPGHHS